MKIYIDKYHLQKYANETLEVVDAKSYVKARQEILSFFLGKKSSFKSIHVFKKPYFNWFNDLDEYTEVVSPKGLLCKKNNVNNLPENLSDEDIIDMGLIELGIEPTEKEIIKYYLGQSLPIDLSKVDSLYTITQIAIEKSNSFNKKYIKRVWEDYFRLRPETVNIQTNNILKPIMALDLEICDIISEGIYCRNDAAYIEEWLHINAQIFKKNDVSIKSIKNLLSDTIINLKPNALYDAKLVRFTTNRLHKKEVLWSSLSGDYNAEIVAILNLKPKLSSEDLISLSKKYATLISDKQKHELSKLVVPTLEAIPLIEGMPFDNQVKKWQNWAINSFIPYKFYLDNQSSEIEKDEISKIEKMSECYSDWLFNNLESIYRQDLTLTNLDIITKINQVLQQSNPKIIWLIIDGFPAFYQPLLESVLKENGINKIKTEWSFAVLPTITEVCIPTMLRGKFESSISDSNRTNLLMNASNQQRCTYTSKPIDFRKNVSSPDIDIACIHAIEIDTLLHKNDSEFSEGRENEIKRILQKLIEPISNVVKLSTERQVKLVISTDHGATKCLENGRNITNPKLLEAAKDKLRERCIKLEGKLKNENIDSSEMYLLPKEISRNNDNWAIARGYRYFGKNDSGYRHGGLSPEETIVPVMFCQVSNIEPVILSIKYLGIKKLAFGKTEKDFSIQIRNMSIPTIELIAISIEEDDNCIFELPVKLEGNNYISLKSNLKLPRKLERKATNGELDLTINIKYLLLGESIEQKYPFTIFTEKDEFGDDLDF